MRSRVFWRKTRPTLFVPARSSHVVVPKDVAPVLTSLRDVVIDTAGGGRVQIATGTGFLASSVIVVGGVDVATTYVSATEVQCTMPAHAAGSVDVKVRNGAAESNGIGVEYGNVSSVAATLHWWRPDLGLTLDDDGNVLSLADQVGTLEQRGDSGEAAPPTVSTSATYGQPVLVGAAGADAQWALVTPGADEATSSPISVVIVGHTANLDEYSSYFGAPNSEASGYALVYRHKTTHKIRVESSSGNGSHDTTTESTVPAAILITDDGSAASTAMRAYVNDWSAPEITAAKWWVPDVKPNIGRGAAGTANFRGEIAEIAIFSGILSSGDKAFVAAYLAQRYDLPVTA